MTDQLEVISKYSLIEIIGLIVAITVVISIISQFFKKVYGDLEEWRKRKNHVEDEKEEIEKRVAKLEESDKHFEDALDTISAGVQQIASTVDMLSTDLNKKLDHIEEEGNRRAVISNRSLLYNLHKSFMEKGELTLAEREMVDAIASSYIEAGGNSIFKSKIIPELEALPIKD